jgi:translation initiation factor IF-1
MEGVVVQKLDGELYQVRLEDGKELVAHVARELRDLIARVKPGDRVVVARAPNDPARGSILELSASLRSSARTNRNGADG